MAVPDIISLGLRHGKAEASAPPPVPAAAVDPFDALKGLVVRAVGVVQELIAAEADPEDVELLKELQELARVIGVATDGPPAADTGLACLQRSRAVADRTRQRRVERRREMASILALVRDVVSAAASEIMSIHSGIEVSTDRFEAIAELEDPQQIKALLMSQVSLLKQMAAERRASWDARQKLFATKVAELEEQLEATRNEASLDPLTGVANHGAFHRECQTRIQRASTRFVLAILDVDDFKSCNDNHGHAMGDRVLLTLAQGLRRKLRDEDFVARIGGDEFAVMMTNVTLRQAESRFTSLLGSVFTAPEDGTEPMPCSPSVSCGLAEFSAGDTYASLYERSDQALYMAKRAGKRRVVAKERAYMRDLMRR
ncbi:MAG: GGDEF domain-containing protein [Vicinamibacterales bacterium]